MVRLPYPFVVDDLQYLPNTISITRQVARTHFGLGSRVTMMKLFDVADLGVLQVGIKGIGKTASLFALESMAHKQYITRDFQTLAGTGSQSGAKFQKFLSDSEITWVCPDLARLSPTVMDNTFKFVCALITEHKMIGDTATYSIDVQNTRVSWLGACTYEIYNGLNGSVLWRGNFSDRIMRYFCFLWGRGKINRNIPEARLVLNFPTEDEVKLNETENYKSVIQMFELQLTDERAEEYADRLIKASAILNMRRETVDADCKFLLLHHFPFTAEAWVGWRKTPTSPMMIDSDALLLFAECLKKGGVDVSHFVARYRCPVEWVEWTVNSYPNLFLVNRTDDNRVIIYPNPDITRKKLLPLKQFEEWCLKYGKTFVR